MTVNLFIYQNQSKNIEMFRHLNALDTHQTNNEHTQSKMWLPPQKIFAVPCHINCTPHPPPQFEVSKEKLADFENKSVDILDMPHVIRHLRFPMASRLSELSLEGIFLFGPLIIIELQIATLSCERESRRVI